MADTPRAPRKRVCLLVVGYGANPPEVALYFEEKIPTQMLENISAAKEGEDWLEVLFKGYATEAERENADKLLCQAKACDLIDVGGIPPEYEVIKVASFHCF